MPAFLHAIYRELLAHRRREVRFWILTMFLATFVIARFLVYFFPELFIEIDGTRIHHFTWGVFLLAVTGYLALVVRNIRWKPCIAAVYGIGLALVFDEFGMWLRLEDTYWIRLSYDAIIIISLWLVNAVYFADVWKRLWSAAFRMISREAWGLEAEERL